MFGSGLDEEPVAADQGDHALGGEGGAVEGGSAAAALDGVDRGDRCVVVLNGGDGGEVARFDVTHDAAQRQHDAFVGFVVGVAVDGELEGVAVAAFGDAGRERSERYVVGAGGGGAGAGVGDGEGHAACRRGDAETDGDDECAGAAVAFGAGDVGDAENRAEHAVGGMAAQPAEGVVGEDVPLVGRDELVVDRGVADADGVLAPDGVVGGGAAPFGARVETDIAERIHHAAVARARAALAQHQRVVAVEVDRAVALHVALGEDGRIGAGVAEHQDIAGAEGAGQEDVVARAGCAVRVQL